MVTTHRSLFTCLQGSQPPEWVSGSLLLGLVSEDPYCGIQFSLGPPLAVWDGTLIPQGESSLPEEHCSSLASHANAALSGLYCCCINLHLKLTIKCF